MSLRDDPPQGNPGDANDVRANGHAGDIRNLKEIAARLNSLLHSYEEPTPDDIASWLALLDRGSGHAIEIRAPKWSDGHRTANVVSRFKPGAFQAAAKMASSLSGRAPAVYLVLNGVSPALPTGHNVKSGATASDIPRRLWLLIDCDPVRTGTVNATSDEKIATWGVAATVRDTLSARGWPQPIVADSGNGCHLLYVIDLPADANSTELIKEVLKALATLFDTADVKVDQVVHDLPRLVKCYGTWVCKGDDTPERPARHSQLLAVPDRLDPVPVALLLAIVSEALRKAQTAPLLDLDAEIERKRERTAEPKSVTPPDSETRAIAYLAKCDPAISGQRGHDKAFKAACKIGPGFDLTPETALRLLHQHYNPRCEPPWSEKELRHKVEDAYKVEHNRGFLLNADRSRRNGKASGNGHQGGDNSFNSSRDGNNGGSQNRPRDGDNSYNSFNSSHESAGEGEDDSEPLGPAPWVEAPDPAVYYGLAGDIVRAIDPTTESDPLAILGQFLLSFGSVVRRRPHFEIEQTRHYTNEYAVCVGESAMARKGTSAARVGRFFEVIDPDWARWRRLDGLSTGEGLLAAVRDPTYRKEPRKEKGRVVGYEDVMTDEGVTDKRLYVIESEFGGVLRANEREGNRLFAYIRTLWDTGTCASATKSPTRTTDAHVSIVGHITEHELKERLIGSDVSNGFANRFLWFAVRRSKVLPFGGEGFDPAPLIKRLAEAVEAARDVERVVMTPSARVLWESSYRGLTTPAPGKLGAVTNRAAPHTLRLAVIYALLDRCGVIDEVHLAAALELWRASFRCAAHIFGDSLGHPKAERILAALRKAPDGMSRTEINAKVFGRNEKAAVIADALQHLIKHGLVVEEQVKNTGGGPRTVYKVNEKNEKYERTTTTQGEKPDPPSSERVRTDYEEYEKTPPPDCGGCLRVGCPHCDR